MPKTIDPALKERALRMVVEHQQDYPSVTAVSKAVADKLGLGKETVRRWVIQSQVDAGVRDGMTTEEHAEIKRLKTENRRLREDVEILKAASVFFNAIVRDARRGSLFSLLPQPINGVGGLSPMCGPVGHLGVRGFVA